LDFEENIELRVLLLAIYKKDDEESYIDVLKTMENGGVFTLKQGKKYIKGLKQLGFITDDGMTMVGITKAQEVEQEFKI
jgi:nitrogen fixation protein